MKRLNTKCIEGVIYEPTYETNKLFNAKVLNSLSYFKYSADVSIVKRIHEDLSDVA
jgi:hypothetical protein